MQTDIVTVARKKRGVKIIAKKAAAAKSGAKIAATAKINPPTVAVDFYMTTGEAAAYIRMSRQFLEAARYRGDGSGPAYIKVGRSVRYRKLVLDAWMSAHDHAPDKPIFTE